jgi:hypothetical protein
MKASAPSGSYGSATNYFYLQEEPMYIEQLVRETHEMKGFPIESAKRPVPNWLLLPMPASLHRFYEALIALDVPGMGGIKWENVGSVDNKGFSCCVA